MKKALSVLVVDDEPQVRQYIAEVLRDAGWETGEADSAEHAFALLKEREWSVVFCDVMLSGADGFSLLRHCRAELPQLKVVLMTGYGSATGALDATSSGAYD